MLTYFLGLLNIVSYTNLDIHLTNVAVQKTSPDYDPEKGCKWSAQQLRKYLVARHGFNKVIIFVKFSIPIYYFYI